MRRDMDLIRDLMLFFEEHLKPRGVYLYLPGDADLENKLGRADDEVFYHIDMLIDAGLLDTPPNPHLISGGVYVRALTWAGHDFVDAIRSNDVWSKTKAGAQRVGGWTIDLLVDFAKAVLKSELAKHLPGL